MRIPCCPNCESPDQVAVVEWVPGSAGICRIEKPTASRGYNPFEYEGETEIDWDGQVTEVDEKGHPRLICRTCNEDWFETTLQMPGVILRDYRPATPRETRTYRVPLVWEQKGYIYVQASSGEEAIERALGPNVPLPEGEYLEGSCWIDPEDPVTPVEDETSSDTEPATS